MTKPEPRLTARPMGGCCGGIFSPRWPLSWPPGPPPGGPPGWLRLRKSRKNCSNGEPGGNCGMSGTARSLRASAFCVELMLTTAGASLAARSAKVTGAPGGGASGPVGTWTGWASAGCHAKGEIWGRANTVASARTRKADGFMA